MNRKLQVAYSSPFVPPEWIAAHGLMPVHYRPVGDDRNGPMENRGGTCAFLRAFINEVMEDAAVNALVLTTVCDQMRRALDLLDSHCNKPVFLMHVPATWQTAGAYGYYLAELNRLGRFLESLGGVPPSRETLAAVMRGFEKGRATILGDPFLKKGEALTQALNRLPEVLPSQSSNSRRGVPVAVVGGPLSVRDLEIFHTLESLGGVIALDGTENGERMLPPPFNKREMGEDPLGTLAAAYFSGIPDIFQRPNNAFFVWLRKETVARGIRGLVLVRYVFCDAWHAELARIREFLDMPVLDLDLTGQDGEGRTMTRLEAFMEALV